MVEYIRSKGVTNSSVLSAMGKVPREAFVSTELEVHAYVEKDY
jgi:protein-L-isoaspartate O-methyltransferase